MKTVLVVGSGGRECAVAHTFAKSPLVKKVFVAPGNAGTSILDKVANVVPTLKGNAGLAEVAAQVKPDLIFFGPEQPLVDGAVNELKAKGFRCFGPTLEAAQLEASKAFSKDFFTRHDLPTAIYKTFSSAAEAKEFLKSLDWAKQPMVVKASGLCAGKGVFIPDTVEEACKAVESIMEESIFGADAGKLVVIEERLDGEECSVLAFCDGTTSRCMPAAQDHKRVGDGDTGPNTGGMGAYAPAPCVTEDIKLTIDDIVQRTLLGLKAEGTPFVGVLFAGFMLTKYGPKLLEYNVRMGDPETQVVLPLLASDLYEICDACIDGRLASQKIEWATGKHAATVVMASKGYPNSYPKDMPVVGFENVPQDVLVFHAGTRIKDGNVVASGGRVLAVTGLGDTLEDAINHAYGGVGLIKFQPEDSVHFRKDIGHRALARKKVKV